MSRLSYFAFSAQLRIHDFQPSVERNPVMRLETRTLYSLLLPHNGLGAPRARPPERSGDRGAPRATAKGVRGGESPPDPVRFVCEWSPQR